MSSGGEISAATGLQRQNLNLSIDETFKYIVNILKSFDKKINFLSSSLRSASAIYKKGGHVTMIYKDQSYTFYFDNKRKIVDSDNSLKDSMPLKDIEEALLYRSFSTFGSITTYQKNLPQKSVKTYKSGIELGVRNFIKALFSKELNLDYETFSNYQELISFINEYKGTKYRLTANNIAALKRRKSTRVVTPETKELVDFVVYIKTRFPNFDENGFFGKRNKRD